MTRRTRVLCRVAAIVVASGIGFVLLQTPARQAEARASEIGRAHV